MHVLLLRPQKLVVAASIATLFRFARFAHAFTFTNTVPTQCDNLTVSWTGGQAPFRLLIVAPGQPIRNFSIPSTAFQNDAGSFTTQLLLSEHQRVMFSMSDATGLTAGGISSLLTVGASTSGAQCNTTSPIPDFFFSLDSDLEECKVYPFSQYSGAVQPITILGLIPSGLSFQVTPPVGDTFSWTNNLPAGTSVSFAMTDSLGRTGGTSDVRVVRLSGDQSCLSTSTPSSPSSTSTSGGSQNTGTSGRGDSAAKKSNTAAIASGVAAGVVALLLAGLLAFLFRRKRKSKGITHVNDVTAVPFLSASFEDESQRGHRPVFRSQSPHSTHNSVSQKALLSHSSHPSFSGSPNTSPMMSEFGADQIETRLQPGPLGYSPQRPSSSQGSSSGPSQYAPQRVIVHTDITESMPLDEPLELPPQYTAGRAPIPGLPSSTTPALVAPELSSSSAGGLPGKLRS